MLNIIDNAKNVRYYNKYLEVFIHYKHSTVTSTKNTKATSRIHIEIRERLDISRLIFYHGAKYVCKEKKYIKCRLGYVDR